MHIIFVMRIQLIDLVIYLVLVMLLMKLIIPTEYHRSPDYDDSNDEGVCDVNESGKVIDYHQVDYSYGN